MTIAGVLESVHIAELAAHVRDEAEFAVGVFDKLLLEVVHVHDVVVVGFDVDGL